MMLSLLVVRCFPQLLFQFFDSFFILYHSLNQNNEAFKYLIEIYGYKKLLNDKKILEFIISEYIYHNIDLYINFILENHFCMNYALIFKKTLKSYPKKYKHEISEFKSLLKEYDLIWTIHYEDMIERINFLSKRYLNFLKLF